MNAPTVASIREGVLRRMERQANTIRLLIVVTSVLGYAIVALGPVALGAHVSRVCNRVVATQTDDDPPFDVALTDALPALVSLPAEGPVSRSGRVRFLAFARNRNDSRLRSE